MLGLKTSILTCMLFAATACDSSAPMVSGDQRLKDRPDIAEVSSEDPEMNRAKAEARQRLAEFLKIVRNRPAGVSDISFKYPLGGWEHIWVENVRIEGSQLTGRLSNLPAQEGHRQGDAVQVPFADVSDWSYRDASGKMQGSFTTRAILDRMPPETAAEIKADFKW